MGKGEDTNDFNKIGPSHIKVMKWNNSKHRTAVAASLVNGVYTLEHDRQENRKGTESLAKPWWEFFNFTLHETLTEKDSSIYGAIFEFKHHKNTAYVNVPHYVIAFRGTILKEDTWMSDMKLNLKVISNSLHRGRRARDAVNKVRDMVKNHNGSPIWLAGHSLGAAIGLLVGKTMKKDGFNLESYIFNPPIEWTIPSELFPGVPFIKDMFQVGKMVVKNTVLSTLDQITFEKDDPTLATWIPYLYVNPADPICAGCIDYFKKKAFMSVTDRISARKSIRNLLFRKNGESSTSDLVKDPLHFLASADIIVNKNKPTDTIGPHDLHQWWRWETLSPNWESVSIRLEDQES